LFVFCFFFFLTPTLTTLPPFSHSFIHQLTHIHTHSHSVVGFTMPDGYVNKPVSEISNTRVQYQQNPYCQKYNLSRFPKRTNTTSTLLQKCKAQPMLAPTPKLRYYRSTKHNPCLHQRTKTYTLRHY